MIGLSDSRSTIVAIASPSSPALRGIVRLAGDDVMQVLSRMTADALSVAEISGTTRPYRLAITLCLGEPLGPLEAEAMIWPTERSYTGCKNIEIQTFGSLPLLESIVSLAIRCGARPAGPGEFTLRAFLAGRLDLPQAEAVLGVIDATNRTQLDAALTQLAGNVSRPLQSTRDQLLNLLADLEAGLDFVEEDISFLSDHDLIQGLRTALDSLRDVAHRLIHHRRSESFDWLVLRGLPNAGKSSLLNALADRPIAIVSDQAGTTRDVVWTDIEIGGMPIRLADTAGIESTDDVISQVSQQMAASTAEHATLVLQCVDARQLSTEVLSANLHELSATPKGEVIAVTCPGLLKTKYPPEQNSSSNDSNDEMTLRVATKGDLVDTAERSRLEQLGWTIVSTVSEPGIESLKHQIATSLRERHEDASAGIPATAARCADAMNRALDALRQGLAFAEQSDGHEYVAAEMRQALEAIGEMTGEIYTDDILDRVFSRFCIGK